jgi:tetratricopeptide (TPR) repeat protein
MGAIRLMHRESPNDFERARQMLEILTQRVGQLAAPHAWFAKWHVLRFYRKQGWSIDQKGEARHALDCTKRALDADSQCALALTIDGLVHTSLLRRLDVGQEQYEHALQINPNESLAWLLKGTLHAFKGEGELAVDGTERALRLSPLDPFKYYYDSLAATAALSAARYDRAIELAERSLTMNRNHTSTLRALAIAQSQLGHLDEARKTVAVLMRLDPTLTASSYLERSPSGAYETGKIWSDALRRAGVPE